MRDFVARLQQSMRAHGPLCIGIDPSAALLKSAALPDTPEGALELGRRVLAAAEFRIGVLKPQSAFFERFGSAGLRALEELTAFAREKDVLVLIDGKRGDIDTTAAAYAEGYFSVRTTLRADAVTTQPYMGLAALDPFFSITTQAGGGVFIVVRSSNPEGREVQLARLPNGETVVQSLCREITARNRQLAGEGMGPLGAVVGATCEDADQIVADLPASFILAPGVGAQGATMNDVLRRMPAARGRVLPNVSRAIFANGGMQEQIRTAIRSLQEQSRALL